MSAFVLVQAAMSAIILAFHLALAAGCLLNLRRCRRTARAARAEAAAAPLAATPRAEVIVAVRNEAAVLPRLLDALSSQTDPTCLFLFVDDRSTDATGVLLDQYCGRHPGRARVIHAGSDPVGLTGKQAALDLAFKELRGELLLFTDGDCVPPPGWVRQMCAAFSEPAVGVVLGRVELPPAANFLGRFQAFDQPLLNQYNLGSAGMGLPTGCFGNNMALRAEAVKATGGFRTLGFSVTEDALLLDAVARGGGWRVRVCTPLSAAVLTQPKGTWKEFIDQHTRWNAGGLFSPDPVTRASYIFVILIYLVGSLLALPLGFLDWRVPLLSLNAFLSIGILAALGGVYEGKERAAYYRWLLPYLFFFGFFYSWITVRALIRRPLEWKGAALRA